MFNQKEVYNEIVELIKTIRQGSKEDKEKRKLIEKALEVLILATPNEKEYNFITAFFIAGEYADRHWQTADKGFLNVYEDEKTYLFERNIDPKLAQKENVCLQINKDNLFDFAEFDIFDDSSKKIVNADRKFTIGDVATISKRVLNRDIAREKKQFEEMLNKN